ncbi:hypothetical protein ACHAWC_010003 [Mediolabrus comicus]
MARFSTTTLALLAAATPAALAFCPTTGSSKSNIIITNLQMSANAQDQPRTTPSWTKAKSSTLEDDFDAPTPYNPQSATELDHDPVVDDECYLGAKGDFDDCVDFDPPKQTNLWTNVLDTPRGQKSRELPKWAQKK